MDDCTSGELASAGGIRGMAMRASSEVRAQLARDIRELFPEVGGGSIDLEQHAPSVLLRALNDGSPALRERVLAYYGPEQAHALAVSRLDRLTNPAYRAYRERLALPERAAGVTHFQSLWRL